MSPQVVEKISLHDPVATICERLGLEPRNVANLDIRPSRVTATVYLLNENGNKYIEDEQAAVETLEFEVTT